jgi:hypothetical protein
VKSKLSPKQAQNMLNFAVKGLAPARNAQSIVTKGVEVLGIGQPLNATLVSERLAWHPNYLISYQQLPYQEDSGLSWLTTLTILFLVFLRNQHWR